VPDSRSGDLFQISGCLMVPTVCRISDWILHWKAVSWNDCLHISSTGTTPSTINQAVKNWMWKTVV